MAKNALKKLFMSCYPSVATLPTDSEFQHGAQQLRKTDNFFGNVKTGGAIQT